MAAWLSALGAKGATTAEVAKAFRMRGADALRRLEALRSEGRVACIMEGGIRRWLG